MLLSDSPADGCSFTLNMMNANKETTIIDDIVVGEISRSIRRGSIFIGSSFVVGALILGGSVTGVRDVRITLFILAGAIVALRLVKLVLKSVLSFIAGRKHIRENRRIEQVMAGRAAVVRKVRSKPMPVKDQS